MRLTLSVKLTLMLCDIHMLKTRGIPSIFYSEIRLRCYFQTACHIYFYFNQCNEYTIHPHAAFRLFYIIICVAYLFSTNALPHLPLILLKTQFSPKEKYNEQTFRTARHIFLLHWLHQYVHFVYMLCKRQFDCHFRFYR